jgi:alpha-methylacyl-CoA racemase
VGILKALQVTYTDHDNRGSLEPQFFAQLLKGLGLKSSDLPGAREDPATWPQMKTLFTRLFKAKSRAEWEKIFDGTDACVTPVILNKELEQSGFDQRPIVTLRDTPGFALAEGTSSEKDVAIRSAKGQGSGVKGQAWHEDGLSPSAGGEETLEEWLGWKKGKQYAVLTGGLVLKDVSKL